MSPWLRETLVLQVAFVGPPLRAEGREVGMRDSNHRPLVLLTLYSSSPVPPSRNVVYSSWVQPKPLGSKKVRKATLTVSSRPCPVPASPSRCIPLRISQTKEAHVTCIALPPPGSRKRRLVGVTVMSDVEEGPHILELIHSCSCSPCHSHSCSPSYSCSCSPCHSCSCSRLHLQGRKDQGANITTEQPPRLIHSHCPLPLFSFTALSNCGSGC
jgi:hypothetical protein